MTDPFTTGKLALHEPLHRGDPWEVYELHHQSSDGLLTLRRVGRFDAEADARGYMRVKAGPAAPVAMHIETPKGFFMAPQVAADGYIPLQLSETNTSTPGHLAVGFKEFNDQMAKRPPAHEVTDSIPKRKRGRPRKNG